MCIFILLIFTVLDCAVKTNYDPYFYEPLCGESGNGDQHIITYSVENYPQRTSMENKAVQQQVDLSFSAWTTASKQALSFVRADSQEEAHIVISFKEGKHRCVRAPCAMTEAFPDTNYVLAHTFNPRGGSEIHMNGRVLWLESCEDLDTHHIHNPVSYAVLKEILTHEIGHAVGIKHLKGEKTIMHSGYSACSGMAPSIGELDYHVMDMISKYCNNHQNRLYRHRH